MVDREQARAVASSWPIWALLAAASAGLHGAEAATLPLGQPPAAGVILIDDRTSPMPGAATPDSQAQSPFAELNAALATARTRLEELSKAAAMAASAGEARQELSAAKQENQRLRAEIAEVRQASRDAEARITELTKAAEDAAAEAKRIETELVTMRWQNAQLNTSLARAQAVGEQALAEARKTEQALSTKVETLTRSAERSATEIARLRTALADAEHRLETATNARGEGEARLADLQAEVQSAATRSTRLDEQLTALRGRLAKAEDERDQARARVAEVAPETERLRAALAAAQSELGQASRSRRDLEREVAQLRAAAGSAADAARQNLLAVEARIKELNEALVVGMPAADEALPDAAGAAMPKTIPAAAPAPAGRSLPPPAGESPALVEVAATATARAGAVDADLELIKSVHAGVAPLPAELNRVTAELPLEQRLQVQGLLVDLGARVGPRGLALTVPGSGLFAVNSDQIEPTAHDTLAKVAELIDAYKGRPVQIIGYTDSIGEADYNQILSQRQRHSHAHHQQADDPTYDERRHRRPGPGVELLSASAWRRRARSIRRRAPRSPPSSTARGCRTGGTGRCSAPPP
jgi:flagellar motor protein MotB